MSKRIDLTGKIFGKLKVIEYSHSDSRGQAYWKCDCLNCGKTDVIVRGSHLRTGSTKTCGCGLAEAVSKARHKSLVGKIFGRLTVIKEVGKTPTGEYKYECECGCGEHNHVIVTSGALTSGNTQSCGCLQKEKATERMSGLNKGKFKDLAGQKFGKLTAKEIVRIENFGTKGDIPIWRCECDCSKHNSIEVRRDYLVDGIVSSCGCLRHEQPKTFQDLTGKKFGMLTVTKEHFRKNNRTYWRCECECGNETVVSAYSLKSHRTMSCGNHHIAHIGSQEENKIKKYIENMGYKTSKARKILDGKEIDIFVSNKNIGIEFNGSVFHSYLLSPKYKKYFDEKPRLYHRDKFLCAKEKGIHLISIFDVDWTNNEERIKMYLRSLFLPQKEYMARKLEVRKVENEIAWDFVEKYHLQGSNKAMMKINYGLYDGEELYAVMSFGKLRLNKTEEGQYELHRYCVKDGYRIVGGANKLLKHFEREYNPKYILSYSDNDYFLGSIYPRLGFEYKGQSTPRYFWYLDGKEIRREACQIKKLKEQYPNLVEEAYTVNAPNKEDYVMLSLGACKVFRSGNTKWEKYY